MRGTSTSLPLVLLGLGVLLGGTSALPLTKENITFTLAGLGDITGVVGRTMVEPKSAPYSNTTIYKFRNIPYAKPFLRFQQVVTLVPILLDLQVGGAVGRQHPPQL